MNRPSIAQIVAMGGGGFSMEPENPALDRYVLSLTRKERPKICFVPTASGDAQKYIDNFYGCFGRLECTPAHLSVFLPPTTDLRSFVLEQDAIYVGGGNTRNLLALWRTWGLDEIFREAWNEGIVLAGISAGSLCWFESGTTDSFSSTELRPIQCLGFLPGSHSPHYDGEANRRPTYHRMIREGLLPGGYAADDGAALHFVGRELFRVVSSRPAALAYEVRRIGGEISEAPLPTEHLA